MNATKYISPTDIPPHVSLLSKIGEMHQEFKSVKNELMSAFCKEVDGWDVGIERSFNSKSMDAFETNMMRQIEKFKGKGYMKEV